MICLFKCYLKQIWRNGKNNRSVSISVENMVPSHNISVVDFFYIYKHIYITVLLFKKCLENPWITVKVITVVFIC